MAAVRAENTIPKRHCRTLSERTDVRTDGGLAIAGKDTGLRNHTEPSFVVRVYRSGGRADAAHNRCPTGPVRVAVDRHTVIAAVAALIGFSYRI